MKYARFTIRWRRAEEPDTPLECKGLDARTLAARLRNATKHGPIIVDALVAEGKKGE